MVSLRLRVRTASGLAGSLLSIVLCSSLLPAHQLLAAQARVERNVVYGMYSGLALLMDVYQPEESIGRAVVAIPGSGGHAPLAYAARPLKETRQFVDDLVPALTAEGYTVFVVNHRAAPRFRYPAGLEDAQRALRFIRYHAADYGVAPDRIAGVGWSSGAHLVSLLGLLDGGGNTEDGDPVNRESARLQGVITIGIGGVDFLRNRDGAGVASYLGMWLPRSASEASEEFRTYREASLIYHVNGGAAPFLLIHGEADRVVPFEHTEIMERALVEAGVEATLVAVSDGRHWPDFDMEQLIRWLDEHLGVSR